MSNFSMNTKVISRDEYYDLIVTELQKLRTRLLQDYIGLRMCDGWQNKLYERLPYLVKQNFGSAYDDAFKKMRNGDPLSYSTCDMDVSLVHGLFLNQRKNLFLSTYVPDDVMDELNTICEDRNSDFGHCAFNEKPNELFGKWERALYNINKLVNAIDKLDTTLSDNERLSFRRKYTSEIAIIETKIKNLKEEFDELNEIDAVVEKIIKSDDQSQAFESYLNYYQQESQLFETKSYSLDLFIKISSAKGVKAAHLLAAKIFSEEKNYDEMLNRILTFTSTSETIDYNRANEILSLINESYGNQQMIAKKTEQVLAYIESHGFCINQRDNCYVCTPEQNTVKNENENDNQIPSNPSIRKKIIEAYKKSKADSGMNDKSRSIDDLNWELKRIKSEMNSELVSTPIMISVNPLEPWLQIPVLGTNWGHYMQLRKKYHELKSELDSIQSDSNKAHHPDI